LLSFHLGSSSDDDKEKEVMISLLHNQPDSNATRTKQGNVIFDDSFRISASTNHEHPP